jgi:hypothetical protein
LLLEMCYNLALRITWTYLLVMLNIVNAKRCFTIYTILLIVIP